MQNIILDSTSNSPFVVFETNGKLVLKGRSFPADVHQFYQPLIDWASQLNTQSVQLSVDIDYYNTASSNKLFELMDALDKNDNIQTFQVIWHFEPDDEDTLENGYFFAERLKKAKFIFKELAKI